MRDVHKTSNISPDLCEREKRMDSNAQPICSPEESRPKSQISPPSLPSRPTGVGPFTGVFNQQSIRRLSEPEKHHATTARNPCFTQDPNHATSALHLQPEDLLPATDVEISITESAFVAYLEKQDALTIKHTEDGVKHHTTHPNNAGIPRLASMSLDQ